MEVILHNSLGILKTRCKDSLIWKRLVQVSRNEDDTAISSWPTFLMSLIPSCVLSLNKSCQILFFSILTKYLQKTKIMECLATQANVKS